MNAASYVRVSSRAQDLTMQRINIERVASARGDVISAWYEDHASARTMDRAELKRLRADARAGRVSKLYVFRLDRLARTGIRDTLEVVEELRGHGVDLISIADGFDLSSPAAEIILAVMAWAAKVERLAINERISAARERMRAEGKGWGRPSSVSAETRDRARQLRTEQRWSIREIAKAVGITRSTCARLVSG